MKKTVFFLFLLLVLPLQNVSGQTITLPSDTPFWTNNYITIDQPSIISMASTYCAEKGANATALDFFCGYLPLKTADQFCTTSPNMAQMKKYLGNMYISGFYGGVWLRDMLFSNPSDPDATDLMSVLMEMMPTVMKNIMALGTDELIFNGIANLGGGVANLALTGSLLDIIHHNYASVDTFLMIYGYDYGYYFYLIDNPPEGITPESPLQCNRFMDCTMTDFTLTTLNQYKPVVDKVYKNEWWKWWDPTALKYADMYTHMTVTGEGSVSSGSTVWEQIMGSSDLFDAAYDPLIDLSARFMLVSELALLPSMKGYCELNKTAGKCGLLQEAGMMVWIGSYFLGLSSDLPEGTFPGLQCP